MDTVEAFLGGIRRPILGQHSLALILQTHDALLESLSPLLSRSPSRFLTSPCFSLSTIAAFGYVAEQMKERSWYFVCACDERELKDR